jgi:hypothetical protein
MDAVPGKPEKNKKSKKNFFKILIVFISLICIGCIYIYNNFNRLLSDALLKSFDANIVSDVYELKFEKLRVNLFQGDIKVLNVVMSPREHPLNTYPYINSSFTLKTERIVLTNVQIFKLINDGQLDLEKIEIIKPEIQLSLNGKINVLFPIKEASDVQEKKSNKKFVESFLLKEFRLVDAAFRVSNSNKEREFTIRNFNISLNDIKINQQVGKDLFYYKKVDLALGDFVGTMYKGPIKHISFKDYHITIDSLRINKTVDTLILGFNDFNTGIKSLDVQTADSIFHIQMQSFNLSYKNSSITINDVIFKPNMSFAGLQRRYRYSHTDFNIEVGAMNIVNLNFDSLIYKNKIFIDDIIIDKVNASIYSDLTKETDLSVFPKFLGQAIMSISIPISIKQVEVKNANIVNSERIQNGSTAKVNINRGAVSVKNISNRTPDEELLIKVRAFLENKVQFDVTMGFNYVKPQFSLNVNFPKFNLPDLNPVVHAYTPGKINKGVADQLSFSGTVFMTYSTGTMKFLYHDLDVDLQLENKAKWKSTLGAFAANAYLPAANPASKDKPPRIVKYRIERNVHKGFINTIIKSALAGLKETVFMSKENRKNYKQEKKKSKDKAGNK